MKRRERDPARGLVRVHENCAWVSVTGDPWNIESEGWAPIVGGAYDVPDAATKASAEDIRKVIRVAVRRAVVRDRAARKGAK